MQIIELTKKERQLFDNDKCMKCGQKFILNRFMVHSGLFYFHLTCFKKYSEDKIKGHEIEIEIQRDNIKQLEPYKKEMICESLLKEKYG